MRDYPRGRRRKGREHVWLRVADHVECQFCRIRRHWPGAKESCGGLRPSPPKRKAEEEE